MSKGIKLGYEIADRITVLTLKDYRKLLKKELKDHEEKGTYLHDEDIAHNKKAIDALTLIISHFEDVCE